MFKNTPFEAIAKTLSESAPKFDPAAMQQAIRPVQDNLKAWADLAQSQASEAQAALLETVEAVNGTVDAVQKAHPSPEAFAPIAKNLKSAASQAESTLDSAMEKGASMAAAVVPAPKTKRAAK